MVHRRILETNLLPPRKYQSTEGNPKSPEKSLKIVESYLWEHSWWEKSVFFFIRLPQEYFPCNRFRRLCTVTLMSDPISTCIFLGWWSRGKVSLASFLHLLLFLRVLCHKTHISVKLSKWEIPHLQLQTLLQRFTFFFRCKKKKQNNFCSDLYFMMMKS